MGYYRFTTAELFECIKLRQASYGEQTSYYESKKFKWWHDLANMPTFQEFLSMITESKLLDQLEADHLNFITDKD